MIKKITFNQAGSDKAILYLIVIWYITDSLQNYSMEQDGCPRDFRYFVALIKMFSLQYFVKSKSIAVI